MLVKVEKVTLPLLINSLNVDRCNKMDETHNASEKGNVTHHFVLGHLEKKRTVLSLATTISDCCLITAGIKEIAL